MLSKYGNSIVIKSKGGSDEILPGCDLREKTIWQLIDKNNDVDFDTEYVSDRMKKYIEQNNKYFNDAHEVHAKKTIINAVNYCLTQKSKSDFFKVER